MTGAVRGARRSGAVTAFVQDRSRRSCEPVMPINNLVIAKPKKASPEL